MKMFNAAILILVLFYPSLSTKWPMHTVCKENDLEIYYKSCDPVQDFALSIDGCSNILMNTFNIRAALVLRHNIKELSMNINLILNGKSILTYSQKLCEPNGRRFIFCGKKKGEHIYYEGPVTLGIHEIPQGEYTVSAMLYNEDHLTVACADFTIKKE
ncbi:lymphocyte antigen 86 [Chelonoidis abingdonii]|uniref:Lymphocyte antigen 86 n=1 Tax=Chelonoidis abingdonii TaxID=106734 RepID=A0A8C0GHS6_CHEAB|nr:lymphocyte antigen 86 [Chelonoidis abingdonii]